MSKNRVKPVLPVIVAVLWMVLLAAESPSGKRLQQDTKPPSELALLMRAMTGYTDSLRDVIKMNGALPPYPKHFANMWSARATDDEMRIDRDAYEVFTKNYLDRLDALYAGKIQERSQLFNATVQACATCHHRACPGPLVRIKNLYLPLRPANTE